MLRVRYIPRVRSTLYITRSAYFIFIRIPVSGSLLDPSYPFYLLFSYPVYNFSVVSRAPQFVVCTRRLSVLSL